MGVEADSGVEGPESSDSFRLRAATRVCCTWGVCGVGVGGGRGREGVASQEPSRYRLIASGGQQEFTNKMNHCLYLAVRRRRSPLSA